MSRELSIDDIQDRIVSTEKVAHVTFYIVKEREDCYDVYSESEKRGLYRVNGTYEYQQYDSGSHEDALAILREEIQRLEETLEHKRKGIPTAKQLHFLFREKIPIPLTLTWGEASDLIDERLNQKELEKQMYFEAKAEKYGGFIVGMGVVLCKDIYPGKGRIGIISKLTQNNDGDKYAWVEWGAASYEYRVNIDTLKKATDEQLVQLASARATIDKLWEKLQPGTRIHHSLFGEGVITIKASNRKSVYIEFDNKTHSGWIGLNAFTPRSQQP